jgi:hypothetical protein
VFRPADYHIFISYAGEDNSLAQLLYDSLGRIVQFKPYKAENYLNFQDGFKQRIQSEIINSFFMIVLLTEKGKSSQFVNQELGFGLAVKIFNKAIKAKLDPNKDIPIIIPVSQKGIELKGFITKDSNDLLFLDKYASPELFVAEIISCIRHFVPEGKKTKGLTLKMICPSCFDKNGLPYEFSKYLSKDEVIRRLIAQGQDMKYHCPKCNRILRFDSRTYMPLKARYFEAIDDSVLDIGKP